MFLWLLHPSAFLERDGRSFWNVELTGVMYCHHFHCRRLTAFRSGLASCVEDAAVFFIFHLTVCKTKFLLVCEDIRFL